MPLSVVGRKEEEKENIYNTILSVSTVSYEDSSLLIYIAVYTTNG
jgi:hypothetical protein